MGVWKSVGQQVGGLAKHVMGAIAQEPEKIVANAVGAGKESDGNENQAMEAIEQGAQGQQQNAQTQGDDNKPKGFKTQQDFQKYQQLSGNKDEMEMAILRKKLFAEYGLRTDVESGMQQARMEYEEKEKQRKQAAEQKKEEKKITSSAPSQ